MSISAISASNIAATYTSQALQQQQSKAAQQAPATDKVTISKQAQHLANDGDTQFQEVSESGAEKNSEALKGKA